MLPGECFFRKKLVGLWRVRKEAAAIQQNRTLMGSVTVYLLKFVEFFKKCLNNYLCCFKSIIFNPVHCVVD